MPTIYTTELDQIMKECYDDIVTNKVDIIHDLVKMYSSISQKSNIKEDIAKNRVLISDIQKRKDKLLDLSIAGKLSDDEFESRNNMFNKEIDSLKIKIAELEKQERTNAEVEESVGVLRKMIAKEIDFEKGFDNSIIDNLLEKIEVYGTDKKNVIDVKIYIKVTDDVHEYRINRERKHTSICATPYT